MKSRNYGNYPSLAFDLTIGWDLNDPHVVKFMWEVIEKIQPLMIFGSPNCGSFSVLANLNKNRPNYEAKKADGIAHLKIVEEFHLSTKFEKGATSVTSTLRTHLPGS